MIARLLEFYVVLLEHAWIAFAAEAGGALVALTFWVVAGRRGAR